MSFSNLHKDATFMPRHAPLELHWPRGIAIFYFPKGPCSLTKGLPSLGRFPILFLLIGKKKTKKQTQSVWKGCVQENAASRSIKLTPASVSSKESNSPPVNFKRGAKLYHRSPW